LFNGVISYKIRTLTLVVRGLHQLMNVQRGI